MTGSDDNGVQVAEFDIVISGKVGTTDFSWLIECRDRASQGAAPASWIEQLYARRARFNFSKVTAVSTTGFAAPAVSYADQVGIELREVKSLEPQEFSSWLRVLHMIQHENNADLRHVSLVIGEGVPDSRKALLATALEAALRNDAPILKSTKTGDLVRLPDAFASAVTNHTKLFETLPPNGPEQIVQVSAQYTNEEDHFIVDTAEGPVRIVSIRFEGALRVVEKVLPIAIAQEYRHANTMPISQYIEFEPMDVNGTKVTVGMHRIPGAEQSVWSFKPSLRPKAPCAAAHDTHCAGGVSMAPSRRFRALRRSRWR